jgi:hypothetical protein
MNGIEYFHATSQTVTPQELKANMRIERFHRDTQTIFIANNKCQTIREKSTQMTKHGCHVRFGRLTTVPRKIK